MKSSYLGIVFSSIWIVNCFCSTDFRNISESNPTFVQQLRNPNAPKIVWLYPGNANLGLQSRGTDNQGYYTNLEPSVTFAGVESSIRVEDPMKSVAPQVLYDFQRPRFEAASNLGNRQSSAQYQKKKSHNNVPNIVSSETIVNPIQSGNFLQQNIQHPLYNIQPQYYIPKKYALVDGKFVYDPSSLQLVQRPALPTFYHSSQQFPQFHQPILHQQKRVPVNRIPPVTQNRFKAPPTSQLQPIDTPSEVLVKAEQEEEPAKEDKLVSESEEEEGNEEKASYEEDDDDESEHYEAPEFEKYFHDDEDDDHENIENNEDEDDDSDKGSTSLAPSKKFPKKYNFKSDKKDEVIYGHNKKHSVKAPQKPRNKEKMQYKSYRYSKDSAEYPEVIEGRESEQVPVTHKQNILKEKWYLTKSLDNEQYD